MDTLFDGFHGFGNGFEADGRRCQKLANNIKVSRGFEDAIPRSSTPEKSFDSTRSSSSSSEAQSSDNLDTSNSILGQSSDNLDTSNSVLGQSSDNQDTSNSILRFISEILMEEEDLESKPFMIQDYLALQAAEKSFFDVLGQNYPPSPNRTRWPLFGNQKNLHENRGSSVITASDSSGNQAIVVSSLENHCVGDFGKGKAEACEFETARNFKAVDFVNASSIPAIPKQQTRGAASDSDKERSGDEVKGKKNRQRSGYLEGRSNKQSAVFIDESEPEPPEIYDEVLLCQHKNEDQTSSCADKIGSLQIGARKKNQHKKQSKGSKSRQGRSKKQGDSRGVVDLWTLLTQCAQAVATGDQRTAKERLDHIRQNSSAFGDGMQRLAHYFANGLETRLAAGTPLYMPLVGSEISSADILNAYKIYISACPFKRISNIFANRTILKLAEKATKLHIIDFGVLYGFQWPCLIQRLSARPGGPPKLRFTCIELPQPGLRPTDRAEQTGRRLDNYCRRFNVPFEYKVIVQKWETINYEDLQIDMDELNIVNCMYRMKHVPDETVSPSSPRDTVLRLIKKINPDLYVHGVLNGTYSAPFFVTRFREALFHFSALFDMFDVTVPRNNHQRYMFEREVYGRDVMNSIACEGLERVDRPETYKQWQVRTMRAGFKMIPLDQEILKKVKEMVESEYNEHFVIAVDGNWMLQGWKGRVIHALSCWVPVSK